MHVQKGFRPWTLQRLKPAVVPRARRPWASERANLLRDERSDFRVVRNRQGALEALRLVGQVVAAGDRDELVRAVRGLGPFPRDLQEVVPPEVHFLGLDRLELHVHVPPALLFVFHSVNPPKFVGSDPLSRTEGRATELADINLLDETESGAKCPRRTV